MFIVYCFQLATKNEHLCLGSAISPLFLNRISLLLRSSNLPKRENKCKFATCLLFQHNPITRAKQIPRRTAKWTYQSNKHRSPSQRWAGLASLFHIDCNMPMLKRSSSQCSVRSTGSSMAINITFHNLCIIVSPTICKDVWMYKCVYTCVDIYLYVCVCACVHPEVDGLWQIP